MLRKRAVALMNRFIGWIIRTEAAAMFVATVLSLRSLADWHLAFFDPTGGFRRLETPLFHIHGLDDRPRSSVLHSLVARFSSPAS
ncbi:hypothetical protein B0H13DRAFT_2662174 [Mycena leptocephala]|nr:hypothetical protein B0H13DRAFT_2662174 [Mycena leptocephala]